MNADMAIYGLIGLFVLLAGMGAKALWSSRAELKAETILSVCSLARWLFSSCVDCFLLFGGVLLCVCAANLRRRL